MAADGNMHMPRLQPLRRSYFTKNHFLNVRPNWAGACGLSYLWNMTHRTL